MRTQISLPLEGGCRCGAIRYRVTKAPKAAFACHCTDCRQLTSGAFLIAMTIPKDGFQLLNGDVRRWTKTADSGNLSHQYWCSNCHGWTHTASEGTPDTLIVRASTLDKPNWLRPIGQIFLRSAYSWAPLPDVIDYQEEFQSPKDLERAFSEIVDVLTP